MVLAMLDASKTNNSGKKEPDRGTRERTSKIGRFEKLDHPFVNDHYRVTRDDERKRDPLGRLIKRF